MDSRRGCGAVILSPLDQGPDSPGQPWASGDRSHHGDRRHHEDHSLRSAAMGEWGFLSSLLDAVQEHSPMVGRFWLVVMLLFRILVLATVGSDVFEDEQEEFVCNTQQPGCKPVCYDAAFPISHYRFLVFHVVVLSAPAALFVIFAVHQAAKPGRGGAPGQRAHRLQAFYVGSVVARIAAELAFLLGQALLYGFRVQPLFVCRSRPCPHRVDCFVSRPTEKTVFIHFYFVVGLVSALLSLAELAHLLRKSRAPRAPRCPRPGERAPAPGQPAGVAEEPCPPPRGALAV